MLTVGVDLVELWRVRQVVERYGQAFLDRMYAPGEQGASSLAIRSPKSEACEVKQLTCKRALAYNALVDVYRAIADPTRRAILDELVDRSGQTLFELCARLTMKHGINSSRQAVAQHLDVLEAAGLIRTRRAGRSKLHWFEGSPLKAIAERWPYSTDEGGTEK